MIMHVYSQGKPHGWSVFVNRASHLDLQRAYIVLGTLPLFSRKVDRLTYFKNLKNIEIKNLKIKHFKEIDNVGR